MSEPLNAVHCASLEEVRANIDRLDHAIVRLLAERQAYVLQAARFKRTESEVHAPARVEQVMANVRRYAEVYGAAPDIVERGYRALVVAYTEAELAAHRR